MADAKRRRPICGDDYAKLFMDPEAIAAFAPLLKDNTTNSVSAVRHRIIDDHIRATIAERGDISIVTIGAGFDSRPYRIKGGRWIEIEEEPILAIKNERLPISKCGNDLQRIKIDFSLESLRNVLTPFRSEQFCVFVFEGVFLYLQEKQISESLSAIRELFADHNVICDLMRRYALERRGTKVKTTIENLGAMFQVVDNPFEPFTKNDYRPLHTWSIATKNVEYELPTWLHFMSRMVPKRVRNGYVVSLFEPQRVDKS